MKRNYVQPVLSVKFITKNRVKILLFLSGLLPFFLPAYAQDERIPVGGWRVHSTFYDGRTVASDGEKIYCASSTGFFEYDPKSRESKTLSKLDDFSDIGISRLAFRKEQSQLFVAYSNGNLDIYNTQTEEIVNIRTILNYRNIPDKRIFHISFDANLAYLSAAFGIVVIDPEKFAVRDDFSNIGTNGERIAVNAAVVYKNRLYAATDDGLRVCNFEGGTICKDFANWATLPFSRGKKISALCVFDGKLFFATDGEGLFEFDGNTQIPAGMSAEKAFFSLNTNGEKLAICAESGLWLREKSGSLTAVTYTENAQSRDANFDDKGTIWVADARKGLFGNPEGKYEVFTPAGTYFDRSFALKFAGGKIAALSGGFTSSMTAFGNTNGFSLFEAGRWRNFNSAGIGKQIPEMKDFAAMTFLRSENKFYFASYGDGILVYDAKNDSFERITKDNSPLPNNQIVGMDSDEDGNLWVACYGFNLGERGYWRRSKEGQWTGFSFASIATQFPKGLLCDRSGNVHVPLADILGGGLLVFNAKGDNRIMNEDPTNGRLVSGLINNLALDLNGNVWLATNKGLGILYFTNTIFSPNYEAQRPFYKNRPALSSENVTAIAFDGANRAWIGTNNGVWVFGDDGSKLFENFTENNSPLLGNDILAIAVNRPEGEVFFATDKGMISHRTFSSSAAADYSQAKAFPNPVRPDYAGVITITGLKGASNVKITDASGILAFETVALGGTAVWNGTNYKGEKVLPGVYFVFCTDTKGEDTFVTKIAVVR